MGNTDPSRKSMFPGCSDGERQSAPVDYVLEPLRPGDKAALQALLTRYGTQYLGSEYVKELADRIEAA